MTSMDNFNLTLLLQINSLDDLARQLEEAAASYKDTGDSAKLASACFLFLLKNAMQRDAIGTDPVKFFEEIEKMRRLHSIYSK